MNAQELYCKQILNPTDRVRVIEYPDPTVRVRVIEYPGRDSRWDGDANYISTIYTVQVELSKFPDSIYPGWTCSNPVVFADREQAVEYAVKIVSNYNEPEEAEE
jgi:hypothetical protein